MSGAMAGVIHPTRTTVQEVAHATALSEVAWGRYRASGSAAHKTAWERARARALRLIVLLATQNGSPQGDASQRVDSLEGSGRLEGDEGNLAPSPSDLAALARNYRTLEGYVEAGPRRADV